MNNIKNLIPEEYKKYLIYIYKKTNRFGTSYYVEVQDKATKRTLLKRQANVNFGLGSNTDFGRTATKEDVLEAAKKYIDESLSNLRETEVEVKVGDLFYHSWGYDQTNYDYIVVVEVSPTGKTVKARRTGHIDKGYSGQSYKQQPSNQPFGDTFQLRVDRGYDGRVNLVGSYPYSHSGEGYKRHGSFQKVKDGQIFYETDSRFGH